MLCSLLRRLWSCCLETDRRVLKSDPLVLPTENLLAQATGVLTLQSTLTGCVSLWGDSPFFCWPVVSYKYLKTTETEGTKVSPNQTLWPMCCSLPMGFSWSLHVAQSANRARHSVEMTDRGTLLSWAVEVKTHRQVIMCLWTTLASSGKMVSRRTG